MKRLVLAAVAFAAVTLATPADDAKKSEGFVQLFNGKDLTGWKTHPNQPVNWRAVNGILTGGLNPTPSHLYSEQQYHDVHVRVEARINREGDSGVFVRADRTYLRQEFSVPLPVKNHGVWPEVQRYDFLVRTREVSAQEASSYRQLLQPNASDASPYRRAALSALRELTGLDAEPTAAAWRKRTGL